MTGSPTESGRADTGSKADVTTAETVFMAAAAVLSGGRPVGDQPLESLRRAMIAEGAPLGLVASIRERCGVGVMPEEVPVNSELSLEQVSLFAASVVLFALRALPYGDPVATAARICVPYHVTEEFITSFAKEISLQADTRQSSDIDKSLKDYFEPPDFLVSTLRRYRTASSDLHPARYGITHVPPARIQHRGDREASDALRELPGFDELTKFLVKHALEKKERANNAGGRVRVSENQFPGLYKIFRGCVQQSGVASEPELYLENGPINARTFGTERPYMVLQTGAVSLLTRRELEFIIGHELGHIRFNHVLNLTLARALLGLVSQVPFGPVIAKGLELAFLSWQRKAELSADRMGLLVCQDVDAALRVMVKLSGVPAALYGAINVEAFLAQHADLESLGGDLSGAFAKGAQSAYQDHPWTVIRGYELRKWVQSGQYERLLRTGSRGREEGRKGATAPDLLSFECPVCGAAVPPDGRECHACGAPCTGRNRFRRCNRCGVPGKPSLQFCESCGANHSGDAEAAK